MKNGVLDHSNNGSHRFLLGVGIDFTLLYPRSELDLVLEDFTVHLQDNSPRHYRLDYSQMLELQGGEIGLQKRLGVCR